MRTNYWLIISTFLISACTAEGTGEEVASESTEASKTPDRLVLDEPLAGIRLILPAADARPVPRRPIMLARLQRGESFVEWVKPANGDTDELAIVMRGTADEAPIVDMTTAESMRPVELFLALTPPKTALPDSLLAHASDEDLYLVHDPQALDELRARVAEHAADLHLRIREELAASSDIAPKSGSCTAGEIATSRSVYGDGYTTSSTCGDHLGFDSASRTYQYCNGTGDDCTGNSDCDYCLGRLDGAECGLNDPCDRVEGNVQAVFMRSNTNGNPNFAHSGHRMRGFAYNCQGDSGLEMRIRHGAGDWDYEVPIPVNTYAAVFGHGSGFLPARAKAIDLIQNGDWADGIPASGPTFASVEYDIIGSTGVNDHGIFCTGVQRSLTMSPGNPNSCGHGPVSWCTGECSSGSGCFE